ncbi:MAG TPA: STT3 domain-containing protein [Geobacteraceae bacterium]
MRGPSSRRPSVAVSLCLCTSALLAFVLRALPWRNYLLADGSYLLGGPDSYDHLRRILLGIRTFPGLPPYDYYYGYPKGIGQVWAPLFDWLLSLFALVIGAGTPSPPTVTTIGFWFPPVAGATTVFLVYAAGRRLFGRGAGLAAAAIVAILPAHILYTYASRLDHHPAEPLVCLVIVIALAAGMERVGEGRAGWRETLVGAGALLFALLIWRGSVIFWGIGFLALFLQVVVGGVRSEASQRASAYGVRLFLVAGLALLPVCLFNLFGTAAGVSGAIVSWFHVLLLAGCALVFFLLGRLSRGRAGLAVALLLAVPTAAALVLPAGRAFVREFLGGIEVIVGSDPWLSSIAELLSILTYRSGRLDPWYAVENLSFVYPLVPLLLVFLFLRWRRGGYAEFRYPLFLVWGGLFWCLPLFRIRYCHLAAVTTAIGGGLLFALTAEWLAKRFRERTARALATGLLLLLCLPTLPLLGDLPGTEPERYVKYDLVAALRWLRDNTPTTCCYERPDTVPEYGVLADWGLGAHIVNVGERPALATNFGWEVHGLYESAAFQAIGDPAAAAQILRENRIRYLLLNQMIGTVDDDRAIAAYGVRTGKLRLAVPGGYSLQRSMWYRLLVKDGSAYESGASRFAALGTYRLLYESANTYLYPDTGEVSHFKIFEYLPGARLEGSGPAGAAVEVELPLNSPIGRVLTWHDRIAVGPDGRFTLRVPYPTTVPSGIMKPLGDYRLRVGGQAFTARVSEADVYGDRSVTVH